MEKKWRRRNYFIKKELQGKYIFIFFISVVLGSVLYAGIFSLLSASTLTIVYKGNTLSIGKTPYILFAEMLKANWILILSGGIIVAFLAVFLTHRIAGPIYRFEHSINEMARGNLSFNVTLRKNDVGTEVAEALNQLKDSLSLNISSMRKLSDAIDVNLKKASAAIEDDRENALSVISQTEAINVQLRTILESYNTKN